MQSTQSVERERQKREREQKRIGEIKDILLIALAIIASFFLLELALIYGTEFTQHWEPVISNEHANLALREMQR